MRDAFLDLLAGGACVACRRPGRRLCPWCRVELRLEPRPASPTPRPPGLLPVVAAGDYAGVLRAVILAHKERAALGLALPLGAVLADAVSAVPVGQRAGSARVTLVPVPSHPGVVRARGHDPVLRVVRCAALVLRRRGRDAQVRGLLRVVGRPDDQAGLSAEERHANVAGRFRARATAPVSTAETAATSRSAGRVGPVVLVDDVLTTGATLREAQRALQEAGLEPVAAVTLAATVRRDAPT